ncbi:L,D-transpeptidase family protein [Roseibaca sp. Y0-43]|uniref:L,D-transpeptidase family protein n=1 Tax=Roseibaca sp. Y0-43 TaxID=2816854 RepID=UPI001D706380|nr:L,D-transpeptidase family protein [Roseibaca sp. Y0-43]
MQLARLFLPLALLAVLTACAPTKFRSYDGPEVTRVVVYKAERQMDLLHFGTVLKSYRVDLGQDPKGHKQREGDNRTPEGDYVIDRRNPNSAFHLSIGIDYPNQADRERARANGWRPGGDIFIHGRGPNYQRARGDWTNGCIAVTDRQMEDIYAMVRNGTPITIFASKQQELERSGMSAPALVAGGPVDLLAPQSSPVSTVLVLTPNRDSPRPRPSPARAVR